MDEDKEEEVRELRELLSMARSSCRWTSKIVYEA